MKLDRKLEIANDGKIDLQKIRSNEIVRYSGASLSVNIASWRIFFFYLENKIINIHII